MVATMKFSITRPLQATSLLTQQTTTQQTTGIDISTIMNLLLPAMVVGMMAKMISVTPNKNKQVKSPATEITTSQSKKTKKSG
jgi:large-conductance mechanosensitive channel